MEYERFTQELDVRIKSHPSFYLLFEFDALPQCTMCARKRTIQLDFYWGDVISHWIEISTENCRYNAIQVNLKCIWRERLQQTHSHTHIIQWVDCVIAHILDYLSSVSHYIVFILSMHRCRQNKHTLTASHRTVHRQQNAEQFYVNKTKPVSLLEHYDFNKEIIRLVFFSSLEMDFWVSTQKSFTRSLNDKNINQQKWK